MVAPFVGIPPRQRPVLPRCAGSGKRMLGIAHRVVSDRRCLLGQVAVDPVVPSWCNPLEAVRCVELVEGLLQSAMASYRPSSGESPVRSLSQSRSIGSPLCYPPGQQDLSPLNAAPPGGPRQAPLMQEDVGVIAPFRKQVGRAASWTIAVTRCQSADTPFSHPARIHLCSILGGA